MTDDTTRGSGPTDETVVELHPTVDEVLDEQRQQHPEQFRHRDGPTLADDTPIEGDNGGA